MQHLVLIAFSSPPDTSISGIGSVFRRGSVFTSGPIQNVCISSHHSWQTQGKNGSIAGDPRGALVCSKGIKLVYIIWSTRAVTHYMIGADHVSVLIMNLSPPIITITDPRLTTPYPVFDVQDRMAPQPWSLLLKAEDAYTRVFALVNPTVTDGGVSISEEDLRDQIRRLDTHILSIAKDCDFEFNPTDKSSTEERAAHGLGLMGLITRILVHSARIKLHRVREFADIPIFLEKHCDLTFIKLNDLFPQAGSTQAIPGFDAAFPFIREVPSVACLKSSLVVSRALKNLSYPSASPPHDRLDKHNAFSSDTTFNAGNSYTAPYPGTLPYFQCAGMQACYSLYMLVHQVRAALSSRRLAICYSLMSHPKPETELQDAERLLEELRKGCHDIIFSMRLDLAYESIASMTRDLDAVYLTLFPG